MKTLLGGSEVKKFAASIIILIVGITIIIFAIYGTSSAGTPAAPSPSASPADMSGEASWLRYYFDTYHDMYAALKLKDLYTSGEITQDLYGDKYAAAADSISSDDAKEYKKVHKALNGNDKKLSKKDLAKDEAFLEGKMESWPAVISIFDMQSVRDRAERIIKVIDQWKATPDDTSTKAMETALSDSGITNGEKVFLRCYIMATCSDIQQINVDGLKFDLDGYLAERVMGSGLSVKDYFENASLGLILNGNA